MSRPAAVLIALVLLAPGSLAAQRSAYEELQTFSAVLNHVRLNYVDSISYDVMVHAAIEGVLEALDPHSYYVSAAELEQLDALERGELAVTGITLQEVASMPTVRSVAYRSPANRAGIMPGDRIVAIDDTTVAGLNTKAIELRLAGKKGSKVRIELERGPRIQPTAFDVELKRDFVSTRSVSSVQRVDSLTGYVRLDGFERESGREVDNAMHRLIGLGARRVILDLRGNPGGLVISAVDVASLFLPSRALVFRTRGSKGDVDVDYFTEKGGAFREIPLILLIDEGSASAAEALAGSLQDRDRALILGRRSFGKALMQSVFLLPSGGYVRLTVGRVLTPSGRFIQRQYRGLESEQYRDFAGSDPAALQSAEFFLTRAGRQVLGGGGIAPDVTLPGPPEMPVWWSLALERGIDDVVADSVAHSLAKEPATLGTWRASREEWRTSLLEPFLARASSELGIDAAPDSAVADAMAMRLAAHVVEVGWGPEERDKFWILNDPDIRAAVQYFDEIEILLLPPRKRPAKTETAAGAEPESP